MSARHYIPVVVFVVIVIVSDIYCKDASYLRQSDLQNSNWPQLPNQKGATTPWPALGRQPYSPNNNFANNPTWVRPSVGQNAMNPWQRQGSTDNFNAGSSQVSRPVNTGPVSSSGEVTDNELRDFSEALLNKDVNNAAKYVNINLQGRTTSRSTADEAPLPLLSIDKEAFNIVSIEKMMLLHNNYIVESNVNEQYTSQEKQEENNLIDVIINTPVMQYTRDFLIQKGKLGSDPQEFKNILHEIWFNMYARGGGRIGSSGFEHVFLTEIKNNQVSGLHNWLYFDEAEKANKANYLGYMKKLDLGNKGAILRYHFTFQGIDKPVGSMFIGTSPEFEIALYTTCFLLRADRICPLKLNGNRLVIRTYTYRYRGKNMIGSAFPDI